jgi:hypothetical protein
MGIMRRFDINQLPTSSYAITGSFTGSFAGDGSKLTNIIFPDPAQIVFNNITASVNVGPDIFLITSASIDIFKITQQGTVTVSSNANDVFLIKNLIGNNILNISQSGVLVLATQSIELTNPAPNGGIYFTSSSFFVGLDD